MERGVRGRFGMTSSSSSTRISPEARSTPARRAPELPVEGPATGTTRGVRRAYSASISAVPSVLPSSTTTISWSPGSASRRSISPARRARRLRVGITTLTERNTGVTRSDPSGSVE
jgi:hypothetical protein